MRPGIKRLLWISVAFLIFLMSFLSFLPTLLSTRWGTDLVASILEKSLNATVSIDSLSLSFFGPQKIETVKIQQKDLSFSASEILLSNSFIDLLRKKIFLRLKEGQCQLFSPPLLFSSIELELETTSPSSLDLTLFCQAGEGKLSLQGALAQTGFLLPKMQLTACIQALPLQGIDQILHHLFPSDTLSLAPLLGPFLSSDLHIDSDGNSLTVKGKALCENLSLSIDLATSQGVLLLNKPLLIDYTPSTLSVHAEVTSLSYPLQGTSFDIQKLQAQGSFTTSPLPLSLGKKDLPLPPFQGEFSLKEGLTLHVSSIGQDSPHLITTLFVPFQESFFTHGTCHLNASHLPVAILLSALELDPSLSSSIGNTLDLSFDYTQNQGSLSAKTPLLEMPKLSFTGKNSLHLLEPAPFTYTPQKGFSLHGSISKLTIASLSPFSKIDASLEVDTDPLFFSSFKMNPTHFSLSLSGLTDFDLLLESPSVLLSNQEGSIALSPLLIPIHYQKTATQIDFSATSLQIGAFEALLGKEGQIGGTLKKEGEQETIELKMTFPLLKASCLFDKEGQKLSLAKDQNHLEWTLTEEGYRSLDLILYPLKNAPPPFTLSKPTTLIASFSQGMVVLDDLFHSTFELSLSNPSLDFSQGASKQGLSLSNMRASLKKDQTYLFDLSTDVLGGGSFRCQGELLDLEKRNAHLDCTLKQFPSSTCDLLARSLGFSKQPFSALFGPSIQGSATVQIKESSGPIQLHLQSSNLKLAFAGKVVQGTLYLEEPVYLQGQITPAISALAFEETSFYSEAPVTLEIPIEGFSIPLTPFSLKNVKIPKGRLELGRIHCHNEGNLKTMLNLLKSRDSESTGDLPLWFAPLDWQLINGMFEMERTEILLADALDIALFGKIDFLEKEVDMNLGLTQQALAKAFGIQNLPSDYLLLIPLTGPLGKVKINQAGAATKIAMLLAWQKKILSEGFGTGTKGRIIEGFLGAFAQLPDQNVPIPPAKHPFPWEKEEYKKRKASDPEEKKTKKFKAKENPFKQLLKVLK